MELQEELRSAPRGSYSLKGAYFFCRFRTGTRGASSSTDVTGSVIAAEANGGVPREWCKHFGLGQTMPFSVRRYGETSCMALTKEWCDRMQFLFDIWADTGSDWIFVYTAEHRATNRSGVAWDTSVSGLGVETPARERALMMTSVAPQNPLGG